MPGVRSGYGGERDQPALAADRPYLERAGDVIVEEADQLSIEERDPFQWFVDLFVAEYATEARNPQSPARPLRDLSAARRSGIRL